MHQKVILKRKKSTKQRFKVCKSRVYLKCLLFLKYFRLRYSLSASELDDTQNCYKYIYQIINDKSFYVFFSVIQLVSSLFISVFGSFSVVWFLFYWNYRNIGERQFKIMIKVISDPHFHITLTTINL